MKNNDSLAAEVLSAYYAYYRKPFPRKGPQTLQSYYMRLQVEGQCKVLVNNQWQTMTSGDLLMFKPGEVTEFWFEPNYNKTEESCNANYYIFCQGSWLETWWNAKKRPKRARLILNESLLAIFKEIVLEQYKIRDQWSEASSYLLHTLCIHIDRAMETAHYNSKHQLLIAQQMKYYINEFAYSSFKVEDVAKHVDLGLSQASLIFKCIFGQSMISYALEVRLSAARDFMRNTNLALEEIAEKSGFGSYSYFHRAFHKKYGLSPRTYRGSVTALLLENVATQIETIKDSQT